MNIHCTVSKHFVMSTTRKVLCVGWGDRLVLPKDYSLTRLKNSTGWRRNDFGNRTENCVTAWTCTRSVWMIIKSLTKNCATAWTCTGWRRNDFGSRTEDCVTAWTCTGERRNYFREQAWKTVSQHEHAQRAWEWFSGVGPQTVSHYQYAQESVGMMFFG
jgi:hypothetical protein